MGVALPAAPSSWLLLSRLKSDRHWGCHRERLLHLRVFMLCSIHSMLLWPLLPNSGSGVGESGEVSTAAGEELGWSRFPGLAPT